MADDFITGLALYADRAEWTTLRRRKAQIEIDAQREQPVEAAAVGTDAKESYPQRLKPAVSGIKSRVAAALPTDQVLLRIVRLPTVELSEISEMAALQVDKFSPFPVEQMAVSQELLAQQDKSSLVLIAATLREHVDLLGETLRGAGLSAREVDVEVLGWWRLIKGSSAVSDAERQLLLLVEERNIELIVVQDGNPVMIRSLGSLSSSAPAETATEIAEELNYTVTTLEAEWGMQAPADIHLWHRRSLPAEFIARLKEQAGATVRSHLLDDLPPLSEGLARRAMERGPHMLDLAPTEWKEAFASQRLKRMLVLTGAAFVVLWIVAMGALIVGQQLQKKKLDEARTALAALQAPSREVEQIKEQIRALERYLDPTFSAIEGLREISARLPAGVEITALTYKKYGQIAIRGEADSSDPIYDFFQSLEQTELFPSVKPEGVTQQQRGGRARSQFKLTIELPPEGT